MSLISVISILLVSKCIDISFASNEDLIKDSQRSCPTGVCKKTTDGFNFNLTDVSTIIYDVDEAGCCVICILTGNCIAWQIENNFENDGSAPACYPVTSFTNDTPVVYSPANAFGLTPDRNELSIECWKDEGWQNTFFNTDASYGNIATFQDCCNKCKTTTIETGCAYFVYNKNNGNCSLFSNGDLVGRVKNPDYESGYLSVVSKDKCHVEYGVSYSGAELFPLLPVYPVTPAMCCSICKVTGGCKAWTWYLLQNNVGENGICYLKSEIGQRVDADDSTISGSV